MGDPNSAGPVGSTLPCEPALTRESADTLESATGIEGSVRATPDGGEEQGHGATDQQEPGHNLSSYIMVRGAKLIEVNERL